MRRRRRRPRSRTRSQERGRNSDDWRCSLRNHRCLRLRSGHRRCSLCRPPAPNRRRPICPDGERSCLISCPMKPDRRSAERFLRDWVRQPPLLPPCWWRLPRRLARRAVVPRQSCRSLALRPMPYFGKPPSAVSAPIRARTNRGLRTWIAFPFSLRRAPESGLPSGRQCPRSVCLAPQRERKGNPSA